MRSLFFKVNIILNYKDLLFKDQLNEGSSVHDLLKLKHKHYQKLEDLAQYKKKVWWEKYLRHEIKFRGVGIPEIRKILTKWYDDELHKLSIEQQLDLALSFFEDEFAEDKLSGILMLQLFLLDKFSYEYLLERVERLFSRDLIYDWNTCDWFCVRVLKGLIKKNGVECARAITRWNSSSNVWQARSSVVAFASLTENSEYQELILQSCEKLIVKEERFAKTSVGWILREMSKYNKRRVSGFIENNLVDFSLESLNNAIKYYSSDEKKAIKARYKKIRTNSN